MTIIIMTPNTHCLYSDNDNKHFRHSSINLPNPILYMRKLRQKAVKDLAQGYTSCEIERFTENHITCSSTSQIIDDMSQKEMKVQYEE